MNNLNFTKLCILSLYATLTFSCSGGPSGSSNAGVVAANSNETEAVLNNVGDTKSMKAFLNYLDNPINSSDLNEEQKQLLDNCLVTSSSNLSSPQSAVLYQISGPNCPISYSLSTISNQSDTSASYSATMNYQLKDLSLNPNAKLTSVTCSIQGTAQLPSAESMSLDSNIDCDLISADRGAISLMLQLSVDSNATQFSTSLAGNIQSASKNIRVLITSNTNKSTGLSSSSILINGQSAADDHGLLAISDLFN